MDTVLRAVEDELADIGLTVNSNKSHIMLRDLTQRHPPLPETVLLNGRGLQSASIIKYLGIYITADLQRRGIVMHRIQATYKTLYMLLPFLKQHRLPMTTLLRLYHTVIVPVVTYGLNGNGYGKAARHHRSPAGIRHQCQHFHHARATHY